MQRRTSRWLALLTGLVIGLSGGLAFDTVRALEASSDAHDAVMRIAHSRRDSILLSCQEANGRHVIAKAGIEVIALQTTPKLRTRIEREKQRLLLNEFVDALSPAYLTGKGSLAEREAAGCRERVQLLTKP